MQRSISVDILRLYLLDAVRIFQNSEISAAFIFFQIVFAEFAFTYNRYAISVKNAVPVLPYGISHFHRFNREL